LSRALLIRRPSPLAPPRTPPACPPYRSYPKWGFNGTDPNDSSATVVLATGGRGSTGWTDPASGNFVLLIASTAGIIRYDTVEETAALLRAPCDNTRYNGAFFFGGTHKQGSVSRSAHRDH
jgi:hypothetical protein